MNESNDASESSLFCIGAEEEEPRFGEEVGIVGASNKPRRSVVHVMDQDDSRCDEMERGEGGEEETYHRADSK